VYENNPFFQLDLTGLTRISFAVADDPFTKTLKPRFYPVVYLVNKKNDIKVVLNGYSNNVNSKYTGVFEYCDEFRESGLKINDDRKVKINLGELMKAEAGKQQASEKMIILTVKCFKGAPKPKAGELDRAWFRLQNEDTNQTIDYKIIKTI
jgi:hypothetical protein